MIDTMDQSPTIAAINRSAAHKRVLTVSIMATVVVGIIAAAIFILGNAYSPDPAQGKLGRTQTGHSGEIANVPLPVVESLVWKPIPQEDARTINAAVPFSTEPNPPAAPFRMRNEGIAFDRAVDCLAAAVFYEAGDDVIGQQAVAQVVLNRVRHPAFQPSICGVVFHGAERQTGCQFTFTCDGAMRRYRPSPAAWERARAVARLALSGFVYRPVGHATHYHTDWVVPYWSATLDKITAVGTHLFFRWDGWWGTPRAFSVKPALVEDPVLQMATLSPAHADKALLALQPDASIFASDHDLATAVDCGISCSADTGFEARLAGAETDIFFVRIGKDADSARFPSLAAEACGKRPRCIVMAWSDQRLIPAALPASTAQLQTMDFHFLRDPMFVEPRYRWNCARFAIGKPANCLSHQRLGNAVEAASVKAAL
jgi:hypothetical protein